MLWPIGPVSESLSGVVGRRAFVTINIWGRWSRDVHPGFWSMYDEHAHLRRHLLHLSAWSQ